MVRQGGTKRKPARWLLLLLGLMAAVVILLASLQLALAQPGVRRALLSRASRSLEEASGLVATAEDFELRLLRRRLLVRSLALGAPHSSPFLEIAEASLEVALQPLLRGRLVLESVQLNRARLYLDRPLPVGSADARGEIPTPPIDVRELVLRDGRISGFPIPSGLETWLESGRVRDLGLTGSLIAGVAQLEIEAGAVELAGRGRPVAVLELRGSAAGPFSGPVALRDLVLSGSGLDARLGGTLGLDPEQPLEIGCLLQLDPTLLLGAGSGSQVSVELEADLRRRSGRLRLDAPSLPLGLISDWLPPAWTSGTEVASSTVDLGADVRLEAQPERISGGAELLLRGEDRILLAARLNGMDALPERPWRAEVEVDLLPGSPGSRRLEGRLQTPDLAAPAALEVERGRVELRIPRLSPAVAELEALVPDLVPASLPRIPAGRLELGGSFEGPVADLSGAVDGSWLPAEGGRLRLQARGRAAEPAATGRFTLAGLQASTLAPGLSGKLSGRGEIDLGRDRLRASLELDGNRLAVGEGPQLERLHLELDADGRSISIASLEGRLADVVAFSGRGELTVDSSRPLASSGWFELAQLDVEIGTLRSRAEEPLQLSLSEGALRLERGRVLIDGEPLFFVAQVDLDPEWSPGEPWENAVREVAGEIGGRVGMSVFGPWLPGGSTVEGALEVGLTAAGSPRELVADLRLGGNAALTLGPPHPTRLSDPQLEAHLSGGELRISRLGLRVDEGSITAEGVLGTSWREPWGRLRVEMERPAAGLDEAVLDLRLDAESLGFEVPRWRAGEVVGSLEGELPLALLWTVKRGAEVAAPSAEASPLSLRWRVPEAEWAPLLSRFIEEGAPETLTASLSGSLSADPERPLEATGELSIDSLRASFEGRPLALEDRFRLRLGEGQVVLEPARLKGTEGSLVLRAEADLDRGWTPDRPAVEMVRRLEAEVSGVIELSLLNLFLAGGSASGTVEVELLAEGAPDRLTGHLRMAGPSARILLREPYVTRVEDLDLEVELAEGRARVVAGGAQVNRGEVQLGGGLDLDRGLDLTADLQGIRYRLDFGLLAELSGRLRLEVAPDGSGLLSGEVRVDEGQLTRPIEVDANLLAELFTPIDLTGTEVSPLESIALDLSVSTLRGVRIKNNLADLLARWEPLEVRGNLLAPLIEGTIEVDPGGLVYAFGQTLRLDRTEIVYSGVADAPPSLEIDATSSLQDPSIAQLAGGGVPAPSAVSPEVGSRGREIGFGVATFYGEQLAERLSESLGGARLSLRPLMIFGETDPGARLTLSQDVSPQFTLAASLDLRNAERQTYLLEGHRFRQLPTLTGQVFTTDRGSQGLTLQQSLQAGGRPAGLMEGPRLGKIRVDPPPGVSRRTIRRAVGLERGQVVPDGGAFATEVEILDAVRRRGYPDAEVDVILEPSARKRHRADLVVGIDPGRPVVFRFVGDRLSKRLRQSISTLYRGDFYQQEAVLEMEAQGRRALRSLGFVDPSVEVEVRQAPGPEGGPTEVVVRTDGGRRVSIDSLDFGGLPAAEAERLSERFATRLQRVELAAGIEDADRRLLSTLRAFGYAGGRILSRELSGEGDRLTVEVEPGAPLLLAAIEVRGAPDGAGATLEAALPAQPGDRARADLIAESTLRVEDELRARGYDRPRVQPRLEEVTAGDPERLRLVLDADPGARLQLASARFEGLEATRSKWARGVADLDFGAPLRSEEVSEARRRLYGTGLFSSVTSQIDVAEDRGADLVFRLEERPRYRVAYGVRWDSEDGASAVIDASDVNLLGRGIFLGLRALWASEDRSLRFNLRLPRLLGSRRDLEWFVLMRDRTAQGLISESLETTLQFGFPAGRRGTWRTYGRYRQERIREVDPDPFFPIDIEIRRPFLGFQYIREGRDDPARVTRGSFVSADLSVSDQALGSDFSYARFFGQVNLYRPLGRLLGGPLIWAQSVRVGYAEAFDQELLGDVILRAGGEYSVRGYRAETLGPEEIQGPILPSIDRNALLVINEELRFPLLDPVSGLLFFDAGNTWTSESGFVFDLFKALGFGLRARTPVGMLRLDLAYALDRREFDPELKVYFGFGNIF